MYVWRPPSLSDYYDGMVCVIAESKTAAINLAVEDRYPYTGRRKPDLTAAERRAIDYANQRVADDRIKYRDELRKLKAASIRRGAVHVFGGG